MRKVTSLVLLIAALVAVASCQPPTKNEEIFVNQAPTAGTISRFQFVNYKFVYDGSASSPVLTNLYSTAPVFAYLTTNCNPWGANVLAKDESLNNNKVVAFPALTFASTYCLSLYGWKDASYNVSVSAQIVEGVVMTGKLKAEHSAFYTFQMPPSVFLLQIPAVAMNQYGVPSLYLGHNSGTAQWTNNTQGPISCITIPSPPAGLYYYRVYAYRYDLNFKTAFVLNGPGDCALPASYQKREIDDQE